MKDKKLAGILILENIRSLHNVGAIFRSADAVNLHHIVLAGLTPQPPRHEIEKTALGATKTVSWQWIAQLSPYLANLKKEGYHIYALEQTEIATDLFTTAIQYPFALIVGHEREGVSLESLSLCDGHLQIPMQGSSAHSLNVSSATSIALYELGRRVWYNMDIDITL